MYMHKISFITLSKPPNPNQQVLCLPPLSHATVDGYQVLKSPRNRYAITKAFIVAFLMTFFSLFDVPVFWPILLCYWIVLFALTMKRQIMHMIKYKYVPFNFGKQKCWEDLFVILFFWAALTVITPILIRLSASANLLDYNGEMKHGGIQNSKELGLLSRRALGQKERPASSPSPSPSPELQSSFKLEYEGDKS